MSGLEQHHIRYLEIHGEDEIILLTSEEHVKVHKEDRANGFGHIPKEIRKAAHARSPKGKANNRARSVRFARTEKGKVVCKKYAQSEKGKAVDRTAGAKYRAKLKEAVQ